MKIAYGTYGMPNTAPEDALPALANMGYDGIEIALGEKFPTHPPKLDAAQRQQLRAQFDDLGLEIPALMLLINFLGGEHDQNLEALRHAAQFGHDLGLEQPVISFTMGGNTAKYEEQRGPTADRLRDYAKVATEVDCMIAAEPHVNGAIDRPERAVWLMDEVDSPRVRLNFDISHFTLIGLGIDECVEPMVPYAVHTHVKDGYMTEGKVTFLLPGEGDFDYVAYLKAMANAGWTGHITVEVSGMIWNKPDYDPYAAAAQSYAALDQAFKAAGIARG